MIEFAIQEFSRAMEYGKTFVALFLAIILGSDRGYSELSSQRQSSIGSELPEFCSPFLSPFELTDDSRAIKRDPTNLDYLRALVSSSSRSLITDRKLIILKKTGQF